MVFTFVGLARINSLLRKRGVGGINLSHHRELYRVWGDWFLADDAVQHDVLYSNEMLIINHEADEFRCTIMPTECGREFVCSVEVRLNGDPMGTMEWREGWRRIIYPSRYNGRY